MGGAVIQIAKARGCRVIAGSVWGRRRRYRPRAPSSTSSWMRRAISPGHPRRLTRDGAPRVVFDSVGGVLFRTIAALRRASRPARRDQRYGQAPCGLSTSSTSAHTVRTRGSSEPTPVVLDTVESAGILAALVPDSRAALLPPADHCRDPPARGGRRGVPLRRTRHARSGGHRDVGRCPARRTSTANMRRTLSSPRSHYPARLREH